MDSGDAHRGPVHGFIPVCASWRGRGSDLALSSSACCSTFPSLHVGTKTVKLRMSTRCSKRPNTRVHTRLFDIWTCLSPQGLILLLAEDDAHRPYCLPPPRGWPCFTEAVVGISDASVLAGVLVLPAQRLLFLSMHRRRAAASSPGAYANDAEGSADAGHTAAEVKVLWRVWSKSLRDITVVQLTKNAAWSEAPHSIESRSDGNYIAAKNDGGGGGAANKILLAAAGTQLTRGDGPLCARKLQVASSSNSNDSEKDDNAPCVSRMVILLDAV
ncbi:hypothetical protein K437DRAFT_76775 [Tilletiaria anomala UBC 951]|uniref:Uncharacterized protein n=1 Tax=Tilletiaria anomala (strain ATCC 24038 / CBS 436.72 / UBC 951) TaxID=1037660 RepID=A0A066WFQ8_TILAU|nr:uncharacterized protein K437DRAFT_76775 [Tilletiaria anomala UBC 951]KDN49590.1 hypothetical protein K437DRAFT_76775 [Tilletiaria anomala UBC 951]